MDKMERLFNILKDRGLDPNDKSLHQLEKEIQQCRFFLYKNSPNYSPKDYVSFEEACTAYGYVLDNACPSEEALEVCRSEHDKDDNWLDDVKNRKFFYAKQVVASFDDHPVQKRMLKDGTMDKQALKGSGTINQQIRRLSQYRATQEKFDSLQQAYDNLTKTILSLDIRMEDIKKRLRDVEIENIRQELIIRHMREMVDYQDDPKHLAKIMKERGCTQREVAEEVGKDVRTIKRWWPDL